MFPNGNLGDGEVKRTKSGRIVIPPLAGWIGERICCSLNDAVAPVYISPTLDAKAEHLLPTSMLERLKKQNLLQQTPQAEGKGRHTVSSLQKSGARSEKNKNSTLNKKQKKLRKEKSSSVSLVTSGSDFSEVESRRCEVEMISVDTGARKTIRNRKDGVKRASGCNRADVSAIERSFNSNSTSQENACKEAGSLSKNRNANRKKGVNNVLVVTPYHRDQDANFSIVSKDIEEYSLTDEDSVYRNYE